METINSSFMNWFVLSYATSSLLFGSIFGLLYYFHRNRYLKFWSASLAVLASAYLLLYIVLAFNYSALMPLYLLAIVSGSYLFYLASLDYMQCQEKTIWKILMGLAIILTAGMVYSEHVLLYGLVAFYFFSGLLYFSSGLLFVRSKDNFNRLVGSMIIILSLLIMAYPLIMEVIWTMPWFNLINGMLGLIVILGTLGLHFRYLNQVLRKNQQELKTIIENMTEQISIVDIEGRFTFVSKNHYELYGYTDEELLGRHAWEIIHDEYLSKMADMFREYVSKEEKGRAEFKAVKKGGSLVWVEVLGSALKDNGQTIGVLLVTRDITDRKQAEEALKKSEEKYRFLAENMGDVAWIMDLELNTTYISPSSTRFFGFTPEERIQQTVDQIMPPESLVIIAQKLQEELAKEKNGRSEAEREIIIESEFYYKNGGTVWMESLVRALRNSDGKITGIYGSSRDITERKQAEEALRRQATERAAVDAFTYSVSHDLQAPLRRIEGFSEALLEECSDELSELARDYLRRITRQIDSMKVRTDALLKLSKVVSREIACEEVNLSVLTRSHLKKLRYAEPARSVETVVAPDMIAMGDGDLLSVALESLLDNAWKFTGSVEKARIECGSFLKDGRTVYFVKDNGAGFEQQRANKLFEPFQTLHSEADYAGIGIGLNIVYRIISRHGGEIWAEGESGKGACFYFTLP